MIDAQAVLHHLTRLGAVTPRAEHTKNVLAVKDWLEAELQKATIEHHQDAAGNYWLTLPGKSDRSVVLGSSFEAPGTESVDDHLGIIAGLEIMKAVARREEGRASCTLKLVIWKYPFRLQTNGNEDSAFLGRDAAAYLELHAEPLEITVPAKAPASVTVPSPSDERIFNPRLLALRDEAVLELTGRLASSPSRVPPTVAQFATAGIPTAAMAVNIPRVSPNEEAAAEVRLQLLRAVEAFGRWAESTMHLVAGEPVDLWAREHRMPNT